MLQERNVIHLVVCARPSYRKGGSRQVFWTSIFRTGHMIGTCSNKNSSFAQARCCFTVVSNYTAQTIFLADHWNRTMVTVSQQLCFFLVTFIPFIIPLCHGNVSIVTRNSFPPTKVWPISRYTIIMTINITHWSNFMKTTVILISYYHSALGRHKGRLAKCIWNTAYGQSLAPPDSNSYSQKLQSQGVTVWGSLIPRLSPTRWMNYQEGQILVLLCTWCHGKEHHIYTQLCKFWHHSHANCKLAASVTLYIWCMKPRYNSWPIEAKRPGFVVDGAHCSRGKILITRQSGTTK